MDSDTRTKVKGFLWIVATVFLAAGIAMGLPGWARRIPWSWEGRLSQAVDTVARGTPCSGSAEAQRLMQKLIQRIHPLYASDHAYDLKIHFIETESVNAFATLGAQIYVHSALLRQTESAEELAGVLAHEIAHVEQRHIIQSLFTNFLLLKAFKVFVTGDGGSLAPEIARFYLGLRFTREQERQADEAAYKRLSQAQVDVHGLQNFFSRQDSEVSFISDHASSVDRASMAERYAQRAILPLLSKREWKIARTLCK